MLVIMNVMWDMNGRKVVLQQRSMSVSERNTEGSGVSSTISTDATRGAGGITPPLILMDQEHNRLARIVVVVWEFRFTDIVNKVF